MLEHIDFKEIKEEFLKRHDKISEVNIIRSICYHCDERIELDSKFCKKCGEEIKQCKSCGVFITASLDDFCPCCYSTISN